jgi:tetratricopeptide (TPR) repeat protein
MSKLRPIAAFVLASTLLPACMTPAPTPQIMVKPHSEIRNSPGASVDYYEMGKQHQANGKLGLAMDAYGQALKHNSRHVEARNALATLYSQQGRLAEAELLMREVIAQTPSAAYLHNNLGYIYYLQGNHVAAIRELRTAISLDSDHEWARNNLKLAEAGLDRRMAANTEPAPDSRAETTAKAFEVWGEVQAQESTQESKKASVADAAPAAVPELANQAVPGAVPPKVDVVVQALNEPTARKPVAEILRNSQLPKLRAGILMAKMERNIDARVQQRDAAATGNFRLEVSNGNGVTGFAKRVSQIFVRQGIPVHSLTNHLPFQQVTTEIQYRDGFEREAEQIKNTLRGYAIVARSEAPRNWVDLRVVLGKDAATRIAEIDAEKPARLANSTFGPERL